MRLIAYSILFLIPAALSGQVHNAVAVIGDTATYLEQISENPNNELTNLEDFVPGLKCDIRLATKNGISGKPLYKEAKAYVRKPAAVSLGIVQEALSRRGLGLTIFAAYRPYHISKILNEQSENAKSKGFSENYLKHSRGASVDVSLISLATHEEIQMPSGYALQTDAAQSDYMDLPVNVLENRAILIQVMQQHGFRVSPLQWWHFDFMGWQAFNLTDLSFEELENISRCPE
ncbi:MAG: hypothetical protein L3J66_01660 [Bacteroidales bacterium]|nr:hypothetical protein [Bacteroidales bacterium]